MNHIYGLSVYETPTHFYIIGSDPSGTSFRTLKIDRITETEFIAGEPEHDYSQADIGELLATVSSSSSCHKAFDACHRHLEHVIVASLSVVTPTEKWNKRRNCVGGSGLLRTMEKAFGIIGAVRFLEGYYLLLVSRAKLVASIGFHSVYKVEDVSMVYIPASGAPSHPDEVKYAKLFQSVDFTADFYFSYTYQLSRTLQENCLAEQQLEWNRNHYRCGMGAEQKFVWNAFLLEPLRKNGVSRKWTLELVRGYVAHQMVELPCARLDLVILARRSAAYAGTRFLKRGTNREGAVANDVETEQIVWDSSGPMAFRAGKFTAFVQRRGSVPLFWSQDSTARGAPMVVGKPPIVIDQVEPHALTTAKHFRELRRKYGHPLIVLNLVKREEHKHNENLLHDIFLKTVRYLNDFRQPGKCIDYISFDVSRCNKSGRVLQRLEELGQRTVLSTGWFQSFSELKGRTPASALVLPLRARKIMPNGTEEAIARYRVEHTSDGRTILQHGCARSNCVDCLDRTNVAQFGIGKAALGWQLFSMGFLDSPWSLHLQTELCRVFEEMFDEHGDTLAWQYAGSQLVHSIKTYKRIAIFQERSRDVLQTISRYYSNTFGDFEKQDGINLFLGIFRVPKAPSAETNSSIATQQQHIWAMGSDHYLHFPIRGPKRGEFLDWAVAVGSDNEQEDEEWLAGDGQFKEWLVLKADEADVTLDNNFVELDAELAVEPAGTEAFDLAHRTFELTSLEQLVRANSQMQLRRPIVLESLDQGPQQSGSFMRSMFKSEHSQSPPPANVAPRKGSAASTLSSLAAGTASIVRETSSSIREAANEASEDEGRGAEAEGLIAEMVVTTLDEKRDSVAFACSPAQEATLAVAATEEECDMEADRHRDLLVVEDRNNPAEWTRRDPLAKFKVLRNDRPMPTKRRPTPPLSLGAGLKSPQDVYFGTSPDSPLLAISSADYGIYSRYASASSVVFERHNARRQKRPTVWRLPAPSVRLRQKLSSSPSPSPRPAFGWRKRDKETPEQPKAVSTSPPPHPFRKDFSKLGPMFQFKPALFTVDSAFHTELGEVPEESMRLYREAVDAIRRERVQRGIPSPDSTCVQFRSRNGT